MSWNFYFALFGLLSGISLAIDKFLPILQRNRLHGYMVNYWARVNTTAFPDLARLMAEYFLNVIQQIYGNSLWNFRGGLYSLVISSLLTFSVCAIVNGLETSINNSGIVIKLIIINFPFDFLTILVSFSIMRIVISLSALFRILYVFIDVIIAYCLAVGCVSIANKALEGSFDLVKYFTGLLSFYTTLTTEISFVQIAFASTTLIPTFVYILIFILLVLSKPVVFILRHLLQLLAQDSEQSVFFYSGTLLGVISLLIKWLSTIS